jgi:hypothetical protein
MAEGPPRGGKTGPDGRNDGGRCSKRGGKIKCRAVRKTKRKIDGLPV